MSFGTDQLPGQLLAERLGLAVLKREGHDLVTACIKCPSSDGMRIHSETGVGYCHVCNRSWSRLELATAILGDQREAWRVLEAVGLEQPRGNGHTNGAPPDPLELVARQKSITPESLKAFGATVDRGAVVLPVYGPDGKPCSSFSMWPGNGKGKFAEGKPAGMFFPGRFPQPGEPWHIVEGVKDAAALFGLGLGAAGLNTASMNSKFARLFRGSDAVIVPDRDRAGEDGARKTARVLYGVAKSVRIATLPTEFRDTKGNDVRDVLKMPSGRELLLQALADAVEFEPGKSAEEGDLPNLWTNEGRTDSANARRFVARYGADVRWCDPHLTWFIFSKSRWSPDRERGIEAMEAKRAADLWDEVKKATEPRTVADLIKFAKSSNSALGIRNTLAVARSMVPVLPEAFDADPFLLNCQNGTVDLRTGVLQPHRRDDFLTKVCPTSYNAEAGSLVWDRFLEAIFAGQQDLIDFMRRYVGYCLTGDVREQLVAIFHGGGSNGKSTFIKAITDTLGGDFSMYAPRGFLMSTKTERHLTEQYDLKGRRLVAAVETGDGKRIDEELIKSLTGGEPVRARKMYSDHEQFVATHKLVICTNHKPRIRGTDHAVWRRIALVPFDVRFWNPTKREEGPPELIQDKELSTKLAAEAEGILAWAVRGCLEWQRDGLAMPKAVTAATEGYRSQEDAMGRFVESCCVRMGDYKTPFKEIYDALEAWCNDGGDSLPSRKAVAAWLEDNGFSREMSRNRPYRGIGLLAESSNVGNGPTMF